MPVKPPKKAKPHVGKKAQSTEKIHDAIALAVEKGDKIQEQLWRNVLKALEKKNEKN